METKKKNLGAAAFLPLVNNTIAIIVSCPIAKEIGAKFRITPLSIIPYSVYPFFLIIAACVTIQAGLLRTKEEKDS